MLFEKWPFFVLTVLSCLATFLAQRAKAVISLEQLPFGLRLANAVRSYALYLFKAIWPTDLSVIYPFPSQIPAWQLAGAGVLLGAISWFAWRLRRRFPYLLVGWLWYLGTLVPAIGIVQVVGTFHKGDVVSICDPAGAEFARGLTNYPSGAADKLRGLKTDQIAEVLGACPYEEVVHRDNLAVIV